jgi:hypothetical protein
MVTGQWSWGFYLPTHFHPPFPSEVVREGLTESFYLDLDLAKFYRVCSVGPEQMDCVHANILSDHHPGYPESPGCSQLFPILGNIWTSIGDLGPNYTRTTPR